MREESLSSGNLKDFLVSRKINLNHQQREAVERIHGPTLLLAVPGSGKTTVIVSRLGNMILNHEIPPEKILTVTFSVTSAEDMKRRFSFFFGEELGKRVEFRTIHSLCVKIIQKYEEMKQRKAFRLLTSVKPIYRNIYLELFREFPTDQMLSDLSSKITCCKNLLLSQEEIGQIELPGISFSAFYQRYESYKKQNRLMDFDDQLKYGYLILKQHPDILEYFQNRFPYVNVDEAQDTSYLQHEIIRLLCARDQNLFMVGDEDQSIYHFRGAYPKSLLEFQERYEKGKVLVMEFNYRSTKTITDAANVFIAQNEDRYDKKITSTREKGDRIRFWNFERAEDQFAYLLSEAKFQQESAAVLYRNHDSMIPLLDYFERRGGSFALRETEAMFFSHFIVKDLIHYLRFSQGRNDWEAFFHIYHTLGCALSKKQMEGIRKKMEGSSLSTETNVEEPKGKKNFFSHLLSELDSLPPWASKRLLRIYGQFMEMKSLPPYEAIRFILSEMGYDYYLRGKIKEGLDVASLDLKLNGLLLIAKECKNVKEFTNRLDFLRKSVENGNVGFMNFSTIHSSKGLEFDRVFLVDVTDSIFPGKIPSSLSEEEQRQLQEEERRLFYVAMTRAKNSLEILTVKNREQGYQEPSEFVYHLKKIAAEAGTILWNNGSKRYGQI